mgnify:CR=1 FL=1
MPSYTITNTTVSIETLRQYYSDAKESLLCSNWEDLDLIFEIALSNMDRFPNINLTGQLSPKLYIEKWVKGYWDNVQNLPSQRTANPKSACTDPAIKVIVKATQEMSEEEATKGEDNHNLFMSAENIQGNLLEEYISTKVRSYGLLWCNGNVLRAIDFCNTDGSLLLQIKNKSNTENSSSSNIREGTTIEKWYRLGTKTRRGVKLPDYKWSILNDLVNKHKTQGVELPPCTMSEDEYQEFLITKASANRNLITNL